MRIVYFGTPSDAVPPLRALVNAGHDVALVVTQPDRRRGRRGNEVVASAVKQSASEMGLAIATPERSREIVETVRGLRASLGVVVAFGQLLPAELLAATEYGFVNMHFSLLPRWRGAAPVERAILAGDAETGATIMAMEAGLDTGGIFAERRVPITGTVTAGELRAQLVEVGTALLISELPSIPGRVPIPQHGEVVYAAKLEVAEFRLDAARPASELALRVRAGNPKPGAFMMIAGTRVKVTRARVASGAEVAGAPDAVASISVTGVLRCAEGLLVLEEVQPEGKKPMAARAWRAGIREAVTLDG